jgi:hypothetical protein
MTDRMTPGQLAALRARMAVQAPPGTATAAEPPTHEDIVAMTLADAIRTRDMGAVRRHVHECEHELGPWRVSPWRLIEALAKRLAAKPG